MCLTDHWEMSLQKLCSHGLLGCMISPSLIRQCQAIKRMARKSLSSWEEVGDMALCTSFKSCSMSARFSQMSHAIFGTQQVSLR